MQKSPTPPVSSKIPSFEQLKEFDEKRPSFPGEHLIALGAGLALLMASRRSRSFLMRTVGSALGSALLYRAACGRDGLGKVLGFLPGGLTSRR